MKRNDFTFKAKWLKDDMSVLDINWIVTAAIKYGCFGEDVSNEPNLPFVVSDRAFSLFEQIKKDIDAQLSIPPKKEKMKIPPTLEEVAHYVIENKMNVDPYQFWNFYESKGWFIGKNKMKNWHSAVATWVKRNQVQYGTGKQSDINDKIADIFTD